MFCGKGINASAKSSGLSSTSKVGLADLIETLYFCSFCMSKDVSICRFQQLLTISRTNPGFLHVFITGLLKNIVTSDFSFSHGVFYLIQGFSAIFIEFEIVDGKLFEFGRV